MKPDHVQRTPWVRREIVPLSALALALGGAAAFAWWGSGMLGVSGSASATEQVSATADERPIASVPWRAELPAPGSSSEPTATDPLSFLSPMDFAETDAAVGSWGAGDFAPETVAQTARIDGSSLEAMVDSINTITQQLPEEQARAFQRGVRVIMVAHLPVERLRSGNIPMEKVSEQMLLSGAQQALSGLTPLQVLLAAQGEIERAKANRASRAATQSSTPLAR